MMVPRPGAPNDPTLQGAPARVVRLHRSVAAGVGGALERIKGTSVLTVSEAENFLEKGGVINLIRKEQNLRLGINLAAAGQAKLRISSNLLSVADVVKGKPN